MIGWLLGLVFVTDGVADVLVVDIDIVVVADCCCH